MSIAIGDSLPDLSLPATGNQTLQLNSLSGQPLVLYFYPKDDTPGCTQEGKDFRDHYPEFQQRQVIILGVSRDSVKKHEAFKTKYQLPFDLLADEDEVLCTQFEVIKEKMMFGKRSLGVERSTFLFDKTGMLQKIWRRVKVSGHVEAVLQAIDTL